MWRRWIALVLIYMSVAEGGTAGGTRPVRSWIHCRDDAECPKQCTCEPKHRVECSHLDLATAEELILPSMLVQLKILASNIPTIPAGFIQNCSRLTNLLLAGNNIHAIDPHAFIATTEVHALYLRNNLLNWSRESLPDHVFDPMTNLKILDLISQDASADPTRTYRDDLFARLTNLKQLSVNGLNETVFGTAFSHLVNLTGLEIGDGLSSLSATTLRVFSSIGIKAIRLTSRDLVHIDRQALSYLTSLMRLVVKYAHLSMHEIADAIAGLPDTKLQDLALNQLFSPVGPYPSLNGSFFQNLPRLEQLEITSSGLSYVIPTFVNFLPNLSRLDLSENRLDLYSYGLLQGIFNLTNLASAKLCCQRVADIHFGQVTPAPFARFESAVGKSDVNITISLPHSLKVLGLSGTLGTEASIIPGMIFTGSARLQTFNFSHNTVDKFTGSISFPDVTNSELRVDLSNNEAVMNDGTFSAIAGVLHLENNQFGGRIKADTEGKLFGDAKSLRGLVLTGNQISVIHENTFINQSRLTTLLLNRNFLTNANFEISHMTDLEKLDLSANQLTYLSKAFTDALDRIQAKREASKKKQLFFTISRNPIVCSCDTIYFLDWMATTKLRILLPSACITGQGSMRITRDALKNKIVPHLQIQCNNHSYIVVSSVCIAILVVMLLLSICMYRHRWDIKFFCLKFIRARKKYMAQTSTQHYEYDAFISYHSDDIRWVKEELMPNLEDPGGPFRFCIHQRDFIPGLPTQENILEAMTASRKVLLVVSAKFAKSEWCLYECQLASNRGVDEGMDIIVPVLMEEIQMKDMTKTITTLLKRNTYIEWPNSRAHRAHFWEKLAQALRRETARQAQFVRCECGKAVEI